MGKHGIREILYIRGCRNGFDFLTLVSFGKLHSLIGSLDVGNCFFQKFGQFHARANGQAFADDSSYYLLCSLENVDEDGNLKS